MSKIAVMMSDSRAEAPMSSHFGQAPWIMIADQESGKQEFVENEAMNGRGAASTVAAAGCGNVVVVDMGTGALRHLQMAGIGAWAAPAGITGTEALGLFAEGKLSPAAAHESASHHGGCCCGHGAQKTGACCGQA